MFIQLPEFNYGQPTCNLASSVKVIVYTSTITKVAENNSTRTTCGWSLQSAVATPLYIWGNT
jgi:hypothetical protein